MPDKCVSRGISEKAIIIVLPGWWPELGGGVTGNRGHRMEHRREADGSSLPQLSHTLLLSWPGLLKASGKCPWTESEVSRRKWGQMERESWGLIQLGSVLTSRAAWFWSHEELRHSKYPSIFGTARTLRGEWHTCLPTDYLHLNLTMIQADTQRIMPPEAVACWSSGIQTSILFAWNSFWAPGHGRAEES